MPRLSRINVEQYRAFERGLTFDLRPLTLVYGKNNSGKSSMVRILGIIDDSLRESAESPLELGGDAGKGAAFIDILNARNRELKRLSLTLTWDDGLSAQWSIGLHTVARVELVQVESLTITASSAPEKQARVYWYGNPKVPDAIRPPGAEVSGPLMFRGLIPQQKPALHPRVAELQERLVEIHGHVQYLSAVRAEQVRFVVERGVQPTKLSANGGNAQEVLLSDESVKVEVADWFLKEVGRELRKESVGPKTWQWLLPPEGAPELRIPFNSTGEGMAQLLPILAALGLRRTQSRPTGMSYLALEEPTAQLHDDLQIRLASLFAKIAMEVDPPTIVLETHARPLLLGIQLAIRQGLDPSRVVVYWVDQDAVGASHVEKVEFDSKGLPKSDSLRTAFEDERRLLRELAATGLKVK